MGKSSIKPNTQYVIFGKPNLFNQKINIAHPEIDSIQEYKKIMGNTLQPMYPSSEKLSNKGLNNKAIGKLTQALLPQLKNQIRETLSDDLLQKLNLLSREDALLNIHFPKNTQDLQRAQYRLKFEELFFIQLQLIQMKQVRQQKFKGHSFSTIGEYFNQFFNKHLPFELTNAQKRVLKEIRKDCGSQFQMNRLLQGDVGSGKTLVALMSILMAIDNGYQACLMAPTEILANQHFETISNFLRELPIKVGLLTGSKKAAERKVLHQELENGKIHLLIGTHALLEDKVKYKNLGLVIIDEQHRFGVAQRAKMWQKNTKPPHVLVMTATPIPRTLAMTLYGDLDVSVIDELPPGRKEIKTVWRSDSNRLRVFGFIHEEIKKGRQAILCTLLFKKVKS